MTVSFVLLANSWRDIFHKGSRSKSEAPRLPAPALGPSSATP